MSRWEGIKRKLTPVDEDWSHGYYVEGARLRVRDELQRRPGFAQANFGPFGAAVLQLIPANPSSGPFVAGIISGGTIEGFNQNGANGPLAARWGNIQLTAPDGDRGRARGAPVAPDDGISWAGNVVLTVPNPDINNPPYTSGGDWGIEDALPAPLNPNINSGGANGEWYQVDVEISVTYDGSISFPATPGALVACLGSATLAGSGGDQVSLLPGSTESLTYSEPGAPSVNFPDIGIDISDNLISIGGDAPMALKGTTGTSDDQTILAEVTASFEVPGGGTCGMNFSANVYQQFTFVTQVGVNGTIVRTVTKLGPYDYTPVVDRNGCPWTTAFDVYAKQGAFPQGAGDGVFVGRRSIPVGVPSVTFPTWTPPAAGGDWHFIAVPRRGGLVGPFGRLDD